MNKTDLLGVWKLIKFEISWEEDKKTIYPYGQDAIGYIMYNPNDYMSVHFMSANRPKCSTDDYRSTTSLEKFEMAENYGGYTGKYEIRANTIIHYPEICSFPNFINVPQVREFEFSGNRLILKCSYPGKEHGQLAHSKLLWEKI